VSNTPIRVPQIKSEIAVAIAYLGWSLRQLADYSALIGQPIGEHFLEDALEEPWPDFRSKADPVRVENLTRVLGGLGIGLQDGVFGVVPSLYTRMPAAHGISPVGAVMGLVANYPKAHLRLAIQDPAPGDGAPAAALLINPGNRFILCDSPELEPVELINQLYANCLDRLWVAEYRIRSLASLSFEDAIPRLLKAVEFRSALHLSRGRVIDLLREEDRA